MMSSRERTLQLLLLTVTVATVTCSRTALGPLQESVRQSLALSDNQMALLQGPALALPVVLASVPLGLLIDRRSRVRLLWTLAIINAIGSLATALTTHFWLLFLARCAVG